MTQMYHQPLETVELGHYFGEPHEHSAICDKVGCKPVEPDYASTIVQTKYPEKIIVSNEEVRVTSDTGGQKGSKDARIGSLDPRALMEVAKVAGFGEKKYARLNYMKGYEWSLSYDAMQRHLHAFWSGEDIDPESGLPHLAHAAWHCLALMAFMREHPNYDDRYKREDVD